MSRGCLSLNWGISEWLSPIFKSACCEKYFKGVTTHSIIASTWRERMLGYLSLDIMLLKTVRFSEPIIFSRQIEAIVYITNVCSLTPNSTVLYINLYPNCDMICSRVYSRHTAHTLYFNFWRKIIQLWADLQIAFDLNRQIGYNKENTWQIQNNKTQQRDKENIHICITI